MTRACKIAIRLPVTAMLLAACWATPLAPEAAPTLRWSEGQTGCTFSADDDGRYRYGIWTNDFGIVLAVDSQELQKAARRTEPIFTALLTVHYRGKASLSINPQAITLEFVKHTRDLHPALDPGELAARFRADSAQFTQATERNIHKHPGRKAELESMLQDHQQSVAEMLSFLETHSLRTFRLDPADPEASGWVYFSAASKWIGDWKKQEEFVLRIPLPSQVIEFPFALPPSQGDLLLRHR
ncbi:MAG: hypothetical protein ACRD3L_05020 [Terriglobales bacterium]